MRNEYLSNRYPTYQLGIHAFNPLRSTERCSARVRVRNTGFRFLVYGDDKPNFQFCY
jgi:hypothetical protein